MNTFHLLSNGAWGIRVPVPDDPEGIEIERLEPGTPVIVNKADGSQVEVLIKKALKTVLYDGVLYAIYSFKKGCRVIKSAPQATSLREIWETCR